MSSLACTACGTMNQAGSSFCSGCDAFLGWTGQAVAETQPDAVRGTRSTATPRAAPTPHATPTPRATPTPSRAPDSSAGVGVMGTPALVCGWCRTGNEANRRFCRRCGNWLVTPTSSPQATRPSARDTRPWWLGGPRTPYTGELSRTTIAYRVLAAVGVPALIVLLLALTGQHPVRRVTDLAGHLRGTGRLDRLTATSAEPQGKPAAAVDNVRALGWSPRWPGTTTRIDPDAVCASTSAVGPSLMVTFAEEADVREIGVEAGLPDGDGQRVHRWRPEVIRLDWVGGGCQAIQLDDVPDLQRFGVAQPTLVSGVRVTILSCYPADPAVAGSTDIGEITVWHR